MLVAFGKKVSTVLGLGRVFLPSTVVPRLVDQQSMYQRTLTTEKIMEKIEKINELFVEARDELEFAKEDLETTYFNETFNDAKELVDMTIKEYSSLIDEISDEGEKGKIQRSMGMKMEQLKAEMQQLQENH